MVSQSSSFSGDGDRERDERGGVNRVGVAGQDTSRIGGPCSPVGEATVDSRRDDPCDGTSIGVVMEAD